MTDEDETSIERAYYRAARFTRAAAASLIKNTDIQPAWVGNGDRFWCRFDTAAGHEYRVVDARSGDEAPAFDHQRLADALAVRARARPDPDRLALDDLHFLPDGGAAFFSSGGRRWRLDLGSERCVETPERAIDPHELLSPNGRWAAYVDNNNVWLRCTRTQQIRQLTSDGQSYYGYGKTPDAYNMAINRSGVRPRIQALWSADSTKLATYRLDERNVNELHFLQSVDCIENRRPTVHSSRHPMPGDEHVASARFVLLDIESGAAVWAERPEHTLTSFSPFDRGFVWWSTDGGKLYFIENERGDRALRLIAMNSADGACRQIFEERSDTFVELNLANYGNQPLVRILEGRGEFLWLSEGDGWAHLYLCDLRTGRIKHQVTKGRWVVRDINHVDETAAWLLITASGREDDQDPYYRHLYRVNLDGTGLERLTPEAADHRMLSVPPGATAIVDSYGTVDSETTTVLRHADGSVIRVLTVSDMSALLPEDYRPPEPFRVKAADGETDLYGALFFPSDFDAGKRYPLVEVVYAGPQNIRTPKSSYSKNPAMFASCNEPQSIAELGFICMTVDARGTAFRSKAFHSHSRCHDSKALDDHVAACRQLAAARPYIDLDRVGITGFSCGGAAAARALLQYPDIYKVGVAGAGPYDDAGSQAYWCEKYFGALERGATHERSPLAGMAGNLRGKLLIAYGDLDENCNQSHTMRFIHALIENNRDYGLLAMPNRTHQFIFDSYYVRRTWDYFVEHLAGRKPPRNFDLGAAVAQVSGSAAPAARRESRE